MRSRSRKLVTIVIGTILLPLILYLVYEVSTLNENEQVIERIYKDQLDAIIFSVNQYSDDILNSIVDKIEEQFEDRSHVLSEEIKVALGYNGIKALLIQSFDQQNKWSYLHNTLETPELQPRLEVLNKNNQEVIGRLRNYLKSQYRKVEPMTLFKANGFDYQVIYIVITAKSKEQFLMVVLMDPAEYINEILSPKLQQIGNEELIITMQRKEDERIIYTTDSLKKDILLSKKMWLFPELLVGISSKSATVRELVDQRVASNLIAAGLLATLLITGFFLVFRNLNREIQLAQVKSDFVSSVSHELRTPLALISMFAETLMLGRVKNQTKKQEYFEIIYKETNRLTNIVNRILNFSQIEANRRDYHFSKVDLRQLLQEIIRDYSYHLEQNGFEYESKLPQQPVNLNADREAIYEAVVNLIDNSIKYSKDCKHISIELQTSADQTRISISDMGIGIPKEKLAEIFDKFYRVSHGDVYTVKGAGLGLSIVSHIMEAHGGNVQVDSKQGHGSTFSLLFYMNKQL
ncbi:MAG: ATP-binding protein [Cyclobacteriaceae bacterium]|nr:ATP-binding protein [Cyclobacteriaceae bacterium HetDA_MAG_MS6]